MRELDGANLSDLPLGNRILELLKIDPKTVSSEGFRIHKNHVEYQEFRRTPTTPIRINERTKTFVTKTRIRLPRQTKITDHNNPPF